MLGSFKTILLKIFYSWKLFFYIVEKDVKRTSVLCKWFKPTLRDWRGRLLLSPSLSARSKNIRLSTKRIFARRIKRIRFILRQIQKEALRAKTSTRQMDKAQITDQSEPLIGNWSVQQQIYSVSVPPLTKYLLPSVVKYENFDLSSSSWRHKNYWNSERFWN